MNKGATIGEIVVMVENITKILDQHTNNSSKFYDEIRKELGEMKENTSTLHVRVGMLEKDNADLKKESHDLRNKWWFAVGISTALSQMAHYIIK